VWLAEVGLGVVSKGVHWQARNGVAGGVRIASAGFGASGLGPARQVRFGRARCGGACSGSHRQEWSGRPRYVKVRWVQVRQTGRGLVRLGTACQGWAWQVCKGRAGCGLVRRGAACKGEAGMVPACVTTTRYPGRR
jgi:hypothetical protein